MEVLKEGYRIPFSAIPPLTKDPIKLNLFAPNSIRGRALAKEIESLTAIGAVEPASRTPGYYSRVFVVMKASGTWRPFVDLSLLNESVRGPSSGWKPSNRFWLQ